MSPELQKGLSRDARDWLHPADRVLFDTAIDVLKHPAGMSEEVIHTAGLVRERLLDVARVGFAAAGGVL
jgi:hypothetical protein